MNNLPPEPFTQKEVCEIFRIKKKAVWTWGKKGLLHPYHAGRKVWYPRQEVLDLKYQLCEHQ